MTEGLSARFPICLIEIRLSYPFRHFVPPPLTIRGGSLLCLPCAKRETISAAPLVQRGEVKGGLSARFPICLIEIRLSYPFRHFVPPPLTIRGGIGGCDTSPLSKGGDMIKAMLPHHGGGKRGDKNARATEYCAVDMRFPVPCESGYVKTRRYRQDAKDKAFRRGAYSYVRDPRKTQSDNVLRSIYAFRLNKTNKKVYPQADLHIHR